jgi:hypothetical protein
VPLKVRVFWWRVSNEFMSSRANLHQRHIEPMDTCVTCGAQPETTYHALIYCWYSKQFWKSLVELTWVKIPDLHPLTWIADILDDRIYRECDHSIILCGMWSLWTLRKDRKHGKSPIPIKLAIDWTLEVCFQLTIDSDRQVQNQSSRDLVRWQKPDAGVVKINTDGAFNVASLLDATGAVIRGEQGSFLKASARQIPSAGSALMVEAEALRDGIQNHRSEIHPIL